MLIALTRQVSPRIVDCELTHLARQPIDVALARRQHHAYEVALQELGCQVVTLPAEPDLPDSVFVEDVALVLDELAIITRPGADSRKPETASIANALEPYRRLDYITTPGTLDGGDILCLGKSIYVGISSRSNRPAIEQLAAFTKPFRYAVQGVEVSGYLHLKSAVTRVAAETLLVNRAWIDVSLFEGMGFIDVDTAEPYGANALLIGGTIIYPAGYPRTRERLENAGIPVKAVDVSEIIKAEGAVTCCSLIFTDFTK